MRSPPNRRKLRVLLVEDEEMTAFALQDSLLDLGFDVMVAGDGVAALETASRREFDILLTDLRMPRMGGGALIRTLRSERPDLPVVVMSGQASPDWKRELHREGEGRIALLSKPVNLQAIIDALQDVAGGALPEATAGGPEA